jgi:tetrahydromethanopterin S-methyltransferase subunit G
LEKDGFRELIQRKGSRHHKLTPREQEGNKRRATIRSRVEHVFGVQAQRAGNLLLRTVGIVRARAKIGLRNLGYNIDRMGVLLAASS